MRVVVAEDNELVLRVLLRLLGSRGHACVPAASAAELEQLAAAAPPDAVISDIGLGEEDGVAACLRLRAALPGLRILMMTADPASATRARAAGLGAALLKPFTTGELEAALAPLGL